MLITISGSRRFRDEWFKTYNWLNSQGHLVFLPAIPLDVPEGSSTHNEERYVQHCNKIRRSDMLVVVCPAGYIGETTQMEIDFARSIGVEVRYMTKLSIAYQLDLLD